jgi:hypothetical protein
MRWISPRAMFKKSATILLLMSFAISLVPLSVIQAAPWNPGGQTHPYLTPKWVGYVSGGGEALLTVDVRSDIPGEEVFYAGGPAQPNATPGSVTCLNGQTGNQIWRTPIVGIGETATMQMADVDRDGNLEIIVTLQAPAGLYILRAKNGSILWRAPGIYNMNGTDYSGYFTPVGGRIDGSGVVGDTDGDIYPDIFIGVMAYVLQPNTGKLIHLEWDPTQRTIVERGRVQVWHPCAGGLSLADTDNDGIFELYMNERDVYFGDGSWGRGITSFWADNLTRRWSVYDWGASSNIPMLADVNKDGVVDVITTNLGSGICVLNSTNGRPLKNSAGTVLYNQGLGSIHAHYQSTVYDIDGDGNLELMCADGSHNYTGTQVWDLYGWKLDASINSGYSFKGPNVGDVTGDGVADIIIVTFDLLGTNNGTVQIYNKNFQLMDSFTGLVNRAIGSVVQDTDLDGKNELLILTQGGMIYCFDTLGLSQQNLGLQRARTEVEFYSESRLGASEYVPYERSWPDVVLPNPSMGALNVSTSLSQLSFTLNHPLGQTMSYTVTTTPNIGSSSGSNVNNGLKTVSISGLNPSTTYSWKLNVTDQSGHKTSKTYWFTTSPVYSNTAPTQGTPLLSSTSGGNTVNEDLTCANQSTADVNGNKVTNIYNWFKNGAPITNLNLAFDSKPDADAIYSGTAPTRDYSGNGNIATVFGASWTSSGIVGGAFYFDGNDFIRVEEQGSNLGGNGTWSQMSLELWIKVPANAFSGTRTVIWKPDRYSDTSGSYRLDVTYSSTQLGFTWYITTTAGNTYKTSFSTASSINSWHHVACTYLSGTGLKIFLDGSQRSSTFGTGYVNGTKGPLEIAFNNGGDFKGYLDEIRLYSYAVSSSFINQRYVDTRNGLSSSEKISHNDLAAGDVWMCQITPNDGLTDGTTRNSNTIQVVSGSTQLNRLTINLQGSGDTNPAFGTYQYNPGSAVQVTATAASGSQFNYWLLNGTNVGSANPYTVTMTGNYVLTAVFASSSGPFFSDGLESSNFSAWSGITTTTGSSASVVSILSHSGTFSGLFTVSTGSGTRRAYCYATVPSLGELTTNVWVYVSGGLPLLSGDNMWLIQFVDSGGNALASFGMRADSSGTKWALQYGSTPFALASSSVPSPVMGQWYLLQAYYTRASTGKTIILSVNGVQVVSLSQNTSVSNNVASARFGIDYYVTSSAARIYIDDVTIGAQATIPTLYNLNLLSEQDDISTSNLGSIALAGKDYGLPNTASKTNDTYYVTYTAASGYGFSHWFATGSVSIGNLYGQYTTIAIFGSCSLKAVYFSAPIPYTLHVQISGSGVTNATGDTVYNKGTIVAVGAAASSGYSLTHWLLDNSNVGSANPYVITMNGNHNLTAVFVESASEHLFADGFESGSFVAWSGTTTTTGSSAIAVSTLHNTGTYSGQFTVGSGSGTRRAYSYENLGGLAELTASAYVYVADGLPLVSDRSMWLFQFEGPVGTVLASFGIRADNTGSRWALQYGNTPYFIGTTGPSSGVWYLLEAYFTHAASGKTLALSVNGVEVASLSQNTVSASNVVRVRFGMTYFAGSSAATAYVDDVAIDVQTTPPTIYDVSLQSGQDDASTSNLGSITFDSVNYALPTTASKTSGTYAVTYSAASGYVFNYWVTTGSVSVANLNAQSTTIAVSGTGSLTVVYSSSTHLFTDGFESSGFSSWSGATVTTGSSATIVSSLRHSGSYSGLFGVITGSSTRRAYCYENLGGLAELSAGEYVYIADGLPLANGQSMWLIQFIDSGGNALASFGVRADGTGTKWTVQSGNYPYALAGSSVDAPVEGQWYLLQAYYTHAASGKTIVLTVNGLEVVSLSQNTAGANNVANARFGISYYAGASTATVNIDDVTIDS